MSKLYLFGHPGTGKSTRLANHLVELVNRGIRPDRILVLVPQETHAQRYRTALAQISRGVRGQPEVHTFYGLAHQHVGLFFPRIAPRAGFANPSHEPVWMNVEATQYFLDQIVAPHIGEFEDLRMPRARLLVQILDDMNRAATTGFGLNELTDRLLSAWNGAEPRLNTYRRVQEIALSFRAFCLEHSLVDFSLGMELFGTQLLTTDFYREYVAARYRHVLADNIEEGTPLVHDFLNVLLQTSDTAMLVEDDPGGFRINLGAEPRSAWRLRDACDQVDHVTDERLRSDAPASPARFGEAMMNAITSHADRATQLAPVNTWASVVEAIGSKTTPMRYWTTMVQAVVERIETLVSSGVRAGDIAIVAPLVEDVLRFELEERLKAFGVNVRAVRPSRPLYEHPLARAFVTLAKLGHPHWDQPVSTPELARALAMSIADLDVVRAQMIADAAQRVSVDALPLLDDPVLWNRVGAHFRERYEALQQWLSRRTSDVSLPTPDSRLDLFWERLFNEVLSQPGFGLHQDLDGAMVCDKLITSARAFRDVFQQAGIAPRMGAAVEIAVLGLSPRPEVTATQRAEEMDVGLAYVNTLTQNVLAAQYVPERLPTVPDSDAVLLAPIYTYLTGDYNSRYQFWLDVNTTNWHERFYQPLTHPYVLSREWKPGKQWTDEDEQRTNRDLLARVVGGLAFRCDDKIYLAASQLTVAGQEESGMLTRAMQGLVTN